MRSLSALLVSGITTISSAQLVNGSFEDGTTGWAVPCECEPAFPSPDGAPGAGPQCIGLENYHLDCGCMLFTTVEQITPWITPGPWRLSGWIKSAVPGDEPGSRIALGAGPVFFTPGVVDLWSHAGEWEYKEASFTVDGSTDLDSVRVSLVPDDGNQQPSTLCYFDGIQLTSLLNTGLTHHEQATPAFRPNPATDKLWVNLPDAPACITAIDATGRTHVLNNFTNRDHTFEVDLNPLPGGITLLRITTNSGTQHLRFIKM